MLVTFLSLACDNRKAMLTALAVTMVSPTCARLEVERCTTGQNDAKADLWKFKNYMKHKKVKNWKVSRFCIINEATEITRTQVQLQKPYICSWLSKNRFFCTKITNRQIISPNLKMKLLSVFKLSCKNVLANLSEYVQIIIMITHFLNNRLKVKMEQREKQQRFPFCWHCGRVQNRGSCCEQLKTDVPFLHVICSRGAALSPIESQTF